MHRASKLAAGAVGASCLALAFPNIARADTPASHWVEVQPAPCAAASIGPDGQSHFSTCVAEVPTTPVTVPLTTSTVPVQVQTVPVVTAPTTTVQTTTTMPMTTTPVPRVVVSVETRMMIEGLRLTE